MILTRIRSSTLTFSTLRMKNKLQWNIELRTILKPLFWPKRREFVGPKVEWHTLLYVNFCKNLGICWSERFMVRSWLVQGWCFTVIFKPKFNMGRLSNERRLRTIQNKSITIFYRQKRGFQYTRDICDMSNVSPDLAMKSSFKLAWHTLTYEYIQDPT